MSQNYIAASGDSITCSMHECVHVDNSVTIHCWSILCVTTVGFAETQCI